MSSAFLICVVFLMQGKVVNSVTTQKQNQLGRKEMPCNIYNSFYAGPNKKIEDIILGIKKQLDEIQKDLRHVTKKEDNITTS